MIGTNLQERRATSSRCPGKSLGRWGRGPAAAPKASSTEEWSRECSSIELRLWPRRTMLEIEVIACPICGTRDHERTYYDEHLATRFVRCQQCRSVYLNPRPGAAPRERYYQGTDRNIRSQLRVAASREPAFRFIAAAVHRHKQRGTYLDIGCSTGAMFD